MSRRPFSQRRWAPASGRRLVSWAERQVQRRGQLVDGGQREAAFPVKETLHGIHRHPGRLGRGIGGQAPFANRIAQLFADRCTRGRVHLSFSHGLLPRQLPEGVRGGWISRGGNCYANWRIIRVTYPPL